MAPSWTQALRQGAFSGSVASVLSTAVLARLGARRGQAAAPINASSHWLFADRGLRQASFHPEITATGVLVHHAASVFWGVLHAKAWGGRPQAGRPLPTAASAIVAAAAACFVDFQVAPRRLSPGFEHRLSRAELAEVYAGFAVGLAIGSLLMQRRERQAARRRLQQRQLSSASGSRLNSATASRSPAR